MYAHCPGGGQLGRRLRRLIKAYNWSEEVERLIHAMDPAVVPVYHFPNFAYHCSICWLSAEVMRGRNIPASSFVLLCGSSANVVATWKHATSRG